MIKGTFLLLFIFSSSSSSSCSSSSSSPFIYYYYFFNPQRFSFLFFPSKNRNLFLAEP